MKNKPLLIVLGALVAVVVTAVLLYPKLTQSYSPEKERDQESSQVVASAAADFTVYDMDGNEIHLSDFFGKPIVVNFWATWCEPCKSELPAFDKAYQQYKDDVTFLMVNLTDGSRDTKSSVKEFVENEGYSFPVYFDLNYNASDAYGIYSIPETLFIDANGAIYDTRIGAMREDVLISYIEKLIGE